MNTAILTAATKAIPTAVNARTAFSRKKFYYLPIIYPARSSRVMTQQQANIFADRRHQHSETNNCRRVDDFEQAALDLRPWWLKVNYVNQHLSNSGNNEHTKPAKN